MAAALVYLKGVTTLEYDAAKCTGCRMCTIVCPHRVFRMNGGKAYITDRDKCMECGACQQNCEAQAIEVDAGVGCAYAVIASRLRRSKDICCPS